MQNNNSATYADRYINHGDIPETQARNPRKTTPNNWDLRPTNGGRTIIPAESLHALLAGEDA